MAHDEQPVANGVRTDHPIPNLPFVDDSHIPVEDPDAIEALGRHPATDMWGRCDVDRTGEWIAFTTDPKDHAFAWVVRYHPKHGRSVTLYRDEDAASVQNDWFGDRPLLVRAGGYWWDGDTWYRPRQVISWASESYVRRPVPLPTTITAADLLDSSCKAALGNLSKVARLAPAAAVTSQQWRHDLAMWAAHRETQLDALPADRCVVMLNAPELSEATLLGVEEFAKEAGIAASTLRAYIARDEAEVPSPQATEGGRKRWARPVVQDWLEQRRRDPSSVETVLSGGPEDQLPSGLSTLWKRLTEAMFGVLWGQPASRRRWSRPHRNEQAVRTLANQVGWTAALNLESAVPFDAAAQVIEDAILWQLWKGKQLHGGHQNFIGGFVGLTPKSSRLLGWFIDHKPSRVPTLFGSIVREAEDNLEIPPAVTAKSLRKALVLDGGFSDRQEQLREFMAVALPPEE